MHNNKNHLTIKPLVLTLGLLFILAVFIRQQISPISPKPASVSDAIFSAERAFDMLQILTEEQVPHPVDNQANRVVESRIVSLLREMGYQEEIQDTKICNDSSRGFARCTRVRNIIVHIAGTNKDKGILLSAHYDSVPAGPGGSDAGAAVGTLLETARLLSKMPKPLNSVTLLFNEGEEFGLFGAKAFMQKHPLAKRLQVAINVEARGTTGQSVMFETGEDSGWLVKHYANTTPAPLSSSLFYEVYKVLPNDTDLTIYKEHGLQGLNFAHAERLPHYHTPLDNLANLDKGSLQHHGDNVWGVLQSILNLELDKVESGNLVYTDVLGLFIIQWDEQYSILISLILVVLLLFVLYQSQQRSKINIRSILKTVTAVLLILVTSAITAFVIQKVILLLASTNTPWRANDLPMQSAIWIGVSFTGLLVAKWLSKNVTALDMGIGILFVWVLLSVITSILLPGISFLFILPSLVGLIALLIISFSPINANKHKVFSIETWGLITIIISTAIFFMPIAYVLEIIVGYEMAIAIAIILSFIVSSCMPLLAFKSDSKRSFNKLLVVHLGIIIITSLWTSFQPAYTPLMPQAVNIVYLQNDEHQASLIVGNTHTQVPEELAKSISKSQLLASIPWSNTRLNTAPIDSVKVELPQLKVVNETIKNGRKIVQVEIFSNDKKLSGVRIYIPDTSKLEKILSGSESLNFKGEKSIRNGYYEYHCRGQSCSDLSLTFEFASLDKTSIIVAKVLQGLPLDLQYLSENRGDSATQRHSGDQSFILSTTAL